jgi:exosome complex RNA-binding protein Rrp42 (RNase PH superfamily)
MYPEHSTRPQLPRFPVPLSCAVFDNPTVILPDPSGDETDVCSSVVTVAVDEHEHVCAVKSVGSLALTQAQLQQCIELSQTHARDVAAHIEQAFQHAYGKPTLL